MHAHTHPSTSVDIWHVYVHTRHPLISIKVTTDWHHRSLGSIPPYFTWEAVAWTSQEIWALHPGAVATFQLSWPCEMESTTSLSCLLEISSVVWGVPTTPDVFSAPHSGSLSKGHQDQWECLWALAQVLLKPIRFSLPAHTDTTDIIVFPSSRFPKKFKPFTQTQTNKRLKLQWNTIKVSPKWLSSPNVYLDK